MSKYFLALFFSCLTLLAFGQEKITITGKAIGAANILPPTAANTKPTFRSTLKNFGVGAFALVTIFMIQT